MSKPQSQIIHNVTDGQAFEIAMRIDEARALLYLLGTAVAKAPHGLISPPSDEEQDGIFGLVRTVGNKLSQTFEDATRVPDQIAPASSDRPKAEGGAA